MAVVAQEKERREMTETVLETELLRLRRLTEGDFGNLCMIMQDEETMRAYEGAFSDREVNEWIGKMLGRYREYGFGLWAVELKTTGEFIGQCGITMQTLGDGRQVHEVGYLFRRDFWHNGYATEAARGCMDYAFDTLGAEEVYSIIRDSNMASQRVAERNGMRRVGTMIKHYRGVDMPHYIYAAGRKI